MFDRSASWTLRHSVQANRLLFLGILVLLGLTVPGTEAHADDDRSISTSSASSGVLLQVARSPSSVTHHEQAANLSAPAIFDLTPSQDDIEPVSQGLNLDISLEQTGELHEMVDDSEQNSARVARIASCYEASVGRYHSEGRGAFTSPLSRTAELDAPMTHFTAQTASQRQFDTCSRY